MFKLKKFVADIEEINWNRLSANPNAISLLECNIDKINWEALSRNPNAIHLLEQNLDKIDWLCLSYNKNPIAIQLLEQNIDEDNYDYIFNHPDIFELDYEGLKQRMGIIKEELLEVALHPDRIAQWMDAGLKLGDL